MKHAVFSLKDKFSGLRNYDKTYKHLRKHMDSMPVGYPATLSGVERRLLKAMFDIDEARLAMYMDWRFETADTIFERAGKALEIYRDEVVQRLFSMEKKGAIFVRNVDGVWQFALIPLLIGMIERQVARITPGMYLDIREYIAKIFGIEYTTTAVPQMRVIPVEKSITPDHTIGTYDEIRHIIETTDREISIAECFCRKSQGLLGNTCAITKRTETCMGFGDFGAQLIRNGWSRPMTKEEAFAHIDLSEKEGLVIQPSNEKSPEFLCFCCGDCCGILEILSSYPRPADFVASNYRVSLNTGSCNGCGTCLSRCQMNAFTLKKDKAVLNSGKCIGCGLCVTTCGKGALTMVKKETETVPPDSWEERLGITMAGKKGTMGKLLSAGKGAWGLKP